MVNLLPARAVPLSDEEIQLGLKKSEEIRRQYFSGFNPVQHLYNTLTTREKKALCLLGHLSERHLTMRFEDMTEDDRDKVIGGMIAMKALTDHFPPRLIHSYKICKARNK